MMSSQFARIMEHSIFRMPARRKRRPELKPSDIPTFHYTAHLAEIRWLRHAARRNHA